MNIPHLTKEEVTLAFKKLSPEEQKEVFHELSAYLQDEDMTNELYTAATESFADLWDNEENDHWDAFLKAHTKAKE